MELPSEYIVAGLGVITSALGYCFKKIIDNEKQVAVLDTKYETKTTAQDSVIQGINDQLKDIKKEFADIREELKDDRKESAAMLVNIYSTLNELKNK